MEALQIVSVSWPIAAVAIVFLVAVAINMIMRRVAKQEERTARIQAEKELQLHRQAQKVIPHQNGD